MDKTLASNFSAKVAYKGPSNLSAKTNIPFEMNSMRNDLLLFCVMFILNIFKYFFVCMFNIIHAPIVLSIHDVNKIFILFI